MAKINISTDEKKLLESLKKIEEAVRTGNETIANLFPAKIEEKQNQKAEAEKEKGKENINNLISKSTDADSYESLFANLLETTKQKTTQIGEFIKTNLSEQFKEGVIGVKEYEDNLKKVNDELFKTQDGESTLNTLHTYQTKGLEGIFAQRVENINAAKKEHEVALQKVKTQEELLQKAKESKDFQSITSAQIGLSDATAVAQKTGESADNMQKFLGMSQKSVGAVGGVVTAVDQSVKATQRIVNTFSDLAEQRGINTNKGGWKEVKEVMGVITKINEKVKGAFDSVKSGDIPGAVASVVELIAMGFTSANGAHKKALEALRKQEDAQEHMYTIAKMQADLQYNEGKTIFGSDSWGKASNAAEIYQESLEKLEDSKKKLEDVTVKTGSRKSGKLFWRKQKDVWSGLLDTYPDLIKENGKFDKILAETILKTRTLSDEGKEFLQRTIDNATAVESAYAAMTEYLTGIFGQLGQTIMDVFVDSFVNGKDALLGIAESASKMLEQLVKGMVYSITIQPILDKKTKEMMAIQSNITMKGEEKTAEMSKILGSLVKETIEQQEEANKLLGYAQEQAKENGLDIFKKPEETPPSSKGIESMSQDSANILNGNFFALLQKTSDIRNINESSRLLLLESKGELGSIKDISNQSLRVFQDQLISQRNIEKHTSQAAQILSEIDKRGLIIRN